MSPGWKAAERNKPLFASISRRRSRWLEKTRSWILNVRSWCRNGCAIFVAKTASTIRAALPKPLGTPTTDRSGGGRRTLRVGRTRSAGVRSGASWFGTDSCRDGTGLQDSRGEPKKVHNHERHPPSPIDERKHVASRSFGVTEDDVAVDEAALSNSLLRPRRPPPRRTNEACLLGSGARADAGPSRLSPASASPRGSSRARRAGRRPLARRIQAPRSCGSGALRRLRRAPESTRG